LAQDDGEKQTTARTRQHRIKRGALMSRTFSALHSRRFLTQGFALDAERDTNVCGALCIIAVGCDEAAPSGLGSVGLLSVLGEPWVVPFPGEDVCWGWFFVSRLGRLLGLTGQGPEIYQPRPSPLAVMCAARYSQRGVGLGQGRGKGRRAESSRYSACASMDIVCFQPTELLRHRTQGDAFPASLVALAWPGPCLPWAGISRAFGPQNENAHPPRMVSECPG
jgi:hypothetical protein